MEELCILHVSATDTSLYALDTSSSHFEFVLAVSMFVLEDYPSSSPLNEGKTKE